MQIIEGQQIVGKIYTEITQKLLSLKSKPGLAIILAGNDPASETYVRLKTNKAESLGIHIRLERIPDTTDAQSVINLIEDLNSDPEIQGILVQLPLPQALAKSQSQILNTIDPDKDVDGLTALTNGMLLQGTKPTFLPATVAAVVETLRFVCEETDSDWEEFLKGKNVVVINNSALVGKPLAAFLTVKFATVTILHKYSSNISEFTKQADIIISATGATQIITADMVKAGAIIIDVTSIKKDSKVVGDVVLSPELEDKIAWLSPVPGGIGPITIACLLRNLVKHHTDEL